MLADLERLIALQQIETERAAAARVIADVPGRQAALDERAASARGALDEAKKAHEAVNAARRDAERDYNAAEARLAKFKDQQHAVKTNKEYTAILHEIETAQGDVDRLSSDFLVKMDETEAAAAAIKRAEAALKDAEAAIAADKKALDDEAGEAGARLKKLDEDRAALAAQIEDKRALATFDTLIRTRKSVAVVQAVDGLCAECHVRLRPQVFAEIRRNDEVRQCDSCQRILYYVPKPVTGAAAPDTPAS